MADWTDELKEEVVTAYKDREPTPETTMDIVKELAEEYEKTPNGIRMILSKAGAYVTKAPAAAADKAGDKDKPKRVSKADAIEALEAAIVAAGKEVDSEITARLTGKAAVYFAGLLAAE